MARLGGSNQSILNPIDPFALLEKLQLTTGKAAEFCGVSRRQLCYWTDKGIISSLSDNAEVEGEDEASRRVYDFPSLSKVLLIKQVLQQGRGLKRASKEITNFLEERKRQGAEVMTATAEKRENFLLAQAQRLEDATARVRKLLPEVRSRSRLLQLAGELAPLRELAAMAVEGPVTLQENPKACLQLAAVLDQLEARLDRFTADRE